MISDNNASVRYLMKEMDPSDEVIFEKKMMEDQNLLIEVECFRNVHRRLEELPVLSPPVELTDIIIQHASRQVESKAHRSQMRYFYLSAAAAVLVALFAGLFLITQDEGDASVSSQSEQTATGILTMPGFDLQTQSTPSGVSPWVDNNELLHFTDRFEAGHTSAYDSMFRSSFQRLEPVQTTDRPTAPLHLTGSGN